MPKKKKASSDVDWGSEMIKCLKMTGKFFAKALTWTMNILLTMLLVGAITGIIVGGAFGLYLLTEVDASVDAIDFLKVESAMTSQLYYKSTEFSKVGELVELEDQRLSGEENRVWASYEEFPQDLIDAVVAIEDKRFWTHSGVDLITTVRCTLEYFVGSGTAGASSITQQLIKNVTGDDDVSIQRKAQEIMRALNLERSMTKTQILELYLNTVYFGHRCDGVSAAAYTYFGKDVNELTLVECAAIVGITQNPSKWDPYINPENNRYRRQVVLTAMRDQGYITEEEYLEAWHAEIQLAGEAEGEDNSSSQSGVYSWYTECVIDETITLLMEKFGYTEEIARTKLYTGGLQIVTAQDHQMQKIAEAYFENEDNFEKVDDSVIQPESSFILIHPKTGDVLAVIGARGEKTSNRILNYATKTKRPSGSSIKPLTVFAPALEYGLINYGSVTDDIPINFGTETPDENGEIEYSRPAGYPQNSTKEYKGLVTTHYALAQSINTVSYRTLMKVGIDRSFDFATEKCHLDNLIDRYVADGYTVTDKDYAPLALGQQTYGLTNLEMTAAYSIFANEGVYNYPRFVVEIYDSDWNLLIENKKESEVAISETTASLMTLMMEEVIDSGTGKNLTIKNKIDVAGKTGTTQSASDRWLIGYTPYYIGGVWVGYSMPQPLNNFKTNPVIKTWDGVMTAIHQHLFDEAERTGTKLEEFEYSSDIVKATYCKDSGKLATDACRADPRSSSRIETGYFAIDDLPSESCDMHVMVNYDTVSKAIANEGCPSANIVQVGLLNVQREFPCAIYVTDAQYTFWDIDAMDIAAGGDQNQPYYINAISENYYPAITNATTQYNHSCQQHSAEPPQIEIPLPETQEEEILPASFGRRKNGDDGEKGGDDDSGDPPNR